MINLQYIDGNVYVWTSQDWGILRRIRIVGQLCGQLFLPKQNIPNGLPLLLLNEETSLLLEFGMAVLKEYPTLKVKPSEREIAEYNEYLNKEYNEQLITFRQSRIDEIKDHLDIIVKGKKRKLMMERKKGKSDENGEEAKEESLEKQIEKEIDREAIFQEEVNKISPLSKSDSKIKIFVDHRWFGQTQSEIESQGIPVEWNYPSTLLEKTKYEVFKHFWKKGHYITSGFKFGGDFLVYPGDPLLFHSHFIVICKEADYEFHAPDFMSLVRLGNNVRKTIVLAYLNENDELVFYSLTWPGYDF